MNKQEQTDRSFVREGLLAGLIGAVIVAAWFLIFDLAAGRPFQTPNVLGKIFFRADLAPGAREILPGVVAGYTVVHLAIFALVGVAVAFLAHLTSRNITLRMGAWLGLVIAYGFSAGLMLLFATATGTRLSLWSVLIGNLLGVIAMAMYLWRRYPRLRKSFDKASLGAEVRSPPHPPEVS